MLLLSISACQTHKTLTLERTTSDSIRLTSLVFDSTYVSQDRMVDRSADTILIREHTTEYRYRMLRDTIRQVTHDSIPYEVRVTEYKQTRSPPTWFDRLCRCWFLATIVLIIIFLRTKLHKGV